MSGKTRRIPALWAAGTAAVCAAALGQCLDVDLPHVLGCTLLGLLSGLFLLWTGRLAGLPHLSLSRMEWLLLSLPALGLGLAVCLTPLTGLTLALFFLAAAVLLLWAFRGRLRVTGVVTGLLVCWFFCYCALSNLCLSPDSYSYYEMANTLFTDFGRVDTVRQYVVFTDYGISFPYFYPLLLAVTDGLSGLGLYGGVALNAVLSAGAAVLLLPVSRRICGHDWPGVLAATALLTNRKFLSEVLSGRAIPAAVLCVVLLLLLLCRDDRWQSRTLFLSGLLAGVSMVLRFDNLTVAGFAGLCVLLLSGRGRWRHTLCYAVGLLPPLLPWAAYSLTRFGTLWATDNGGTLTMVEITTPQRFFVPGEEVATLFTAPQEWLHALGGRFSTVLLLLALTFVSTQVLLPGALLLAEAVRGRLSGRALPRNKGLWIPLLLLVFYGLKTLAYCLVGYETARYHAETVVLVLLALCCLLAPLVSRRLAAGAVCLYLVLALWAGLVYSTPLSRTVPSLCTHPSYGSCINFGYQSQDANWSALWERVSRQPLLNGETARQPAWTAELDRLVADPDARVFFISAGGDPYTYGACTGRTTFASIANMTGERFFYLIDHYIRPTHIVVTDEHDLQWVEPLDARYGLTPLGEVEGNLLFQVGGPGEQGG